MQEIAEILPKIVGVFGLAFISMWAAIPAGLALGLSTVVVVITTSLSYCCGAALVIFVGGKVREWIFKRFAKQTAVNNESLLGRIWARYGTAGLGLAAPMLVGAQIGAAIGITLNAQPRALFIWMCIGAVLWSILLTALVTLGVLGAQAVID